jgi:hypothetical protein
MTQQIINVGNVANDGQGTPLRTAFQYINNNFTELYNGTGAAQISNGTSNVTVVSANGNITTNVNGTSNVMVISSTSVAITGDLSVSGNATLSGNILGDRIVNGTTELDIQVANGNANLTIGGTSNVVVWANTGEYVTGLVSVTGNIQGGNLRTAGSISATGNITSVGNLSLTGNIVDTGELWINTSANGNINLNVNGTGQTNIPTGNLSVTANVTAGNVLTAGLMSATANVTAGNVLTAGIVKTTAKTYGTLPTAANAGAGARSFITDGNTATFGSQVIAGGSNAVPVWSNGTNWYVG